MVRVGIGDCERIGKNGCGFLERNTVLAEILSRFARIPFEIYEDILTCRHATGQSGGGFEGDFGGWGLAKRERGVPHLRCFGTGSVGSVPSAYALG